MTFNAKLWLAACYRTDLFSIPREQLTRNYKLCEYHFDEKFYSAGPSRKRLLPNALPTLFPNPTKRTCEGEQLEEGPPKKVSKEKDIQILSDILIQPAIMKPATLAQQSIAEKNSPYDRTKTPEKHPLLDIFSGPSTSQYSVCEPLGNLLSIEIDKPSENSPPGLLSPSASTQTSSQLSSNTPRKRKLRLQIKKMRKFGVTAKARQKEDPDVRDFNRLCDKFLSKPLACVIKTHVALKGKRRKSHRFSMELKQFALTLHFLSPKAYKFIGSLLTLPTKRSLHRITENISCQPGINNAVLYKALQIKLNTLLEQDKHCILCID
ncbi:uncharacterized protein LOC126737064 [Anthonomus grandis grandis]|uniref:uncharacterized protein LOC126737064 n=1 Tax=Anthonomus grandis grandis TaxID=2921223 RepID=UPI002165A765|nr:uncharacterized protein LOC126737064 [Anthonomus grandis grandis]